MTAQKTLHLTNAYHAMSGGIRTFYRALMAGADSRQRQIRLVVPGEGSEVEQCGRHGLIHHVAAPRAPWFDRRYRLLSPAHYLGSRSPIARILAAERPAVVEVCGRHAPGGNPDEGDSPGARHSRIPASAPTQSGHNRQVLSP